jgi:hypothetical protein
MDDMGKFTILARSKVLLYPSRFDGFGIPPMEALYMGTPVVAYDLPVLREVYGDAIKYVEMNNAKLLVDTAIGIVRGKIETNLLKAKEKITSIATLESGCRRITDAIFPLKLSVGILAFNCADTIRLCLEHIYDIADEIIIVEGAVKDFTFAATKDGRSIDGTSEIINDFQCDHDSEGKLKVISRFEFWEDKIEMQNAIAKEVTGDIYMKLDADEFYYMSDIYDILDEFRSNMQLTMVRVGMYHFWKGPTVVAVGGQWDSRPVRFWRRDSAFRHEDNFNYFVKDGVRVEYPAYKEKVFGRVCYHLSYARDAQYVLDKLTYYRNRGIEKTVVDTWSDWKWGMPTQPTHGGGTAELFGGKLPEAVKEFFDRRGQ